MADSINNARIQYAQVDSLNSLPTRYIPKDRKGLDGVRRKLKKKGWTRSLFDTIHAKFVELGNGFHGAPIKDFKYHLDQAKWIHIEPILMGKVVVSNTCSKV